MTPSQQAPSLVEPLNELSAWLSEHNIDMQMPVGMIDPAEAAARITELEGDLKAAFREISKLAREAGEATGRLAMSEAAGIVDGWRERAERAEARCRALENAFPAEPSGWRPEVRAFADLMEAQLRANDHKGGWQRDCAADLFARLLEEASELQDALDFKRVMTGERDPEMVGREAADVANFAMMIADVCGALPPTSEGGGA